MEASTSIDVQTEMFQAHAQALSMRDSCRAEENTLRNYKSPIKEWKAWCAKKAFADGIMVYEKKAILFLSSEVIGRPLRGKAKKDSAPKTLKYDSVRTKYLAAIIYMYEEQRSSGDNPHPHPNQAGLKTLMESLKRGQASARRDNFEDRAIGSLLDSYDHEGMRKVLMTLWSHTTTPEQYLRTTANFIISHMLLLRGESMRIAELPDLFVIDLDNEGSRRKALVLVKDNGKTNPHGKVEHCSAMRNKELLCCPLSALAFYFWRWHRTDEPFPSFRKRSHWYRTRMIIGERSHLSRKINYHTHLDWMKRAYDEAHVQNSKPTHGNRPGGARHAERAGVDDSQVFSAGHIRRAGHWNNDTMANVYLSGLPRAFMRTMAGFPRQGSFYLPRADVIPPPALTQHVFPDVEGWLNCFDGVPGTEPPESDLAGQGFLRLLQELRTVFLQDSPILRSMFPHHPIWEHALLDSPAYEAFAGEVLLAHGKIDVPEDIQLRQSMPAMEEKVTTLQQVIGGKVEYWGQHLALKLESLDASVQDMVQGRMQWIITSVGRVNQAPNAPQLNFAAGSTPLPPPIDSLLQPNSGSIATFPAHSALAPAENAADSTAAEAPSPSYSMSRNLSTGLQAWQEWTVGVGGGPSIQSLDDSHGPAWRRKDKMFYSRRKVLIDRIRQLSAGGDPRRACSDLEQIRLQSNRSLDALQKWLNSERKKGSW